MNTNASPFIVGLTGGIASGKTQVSDQLSGLGVTVIDTDVIAREVVSPGSDGLQQVVARFGDSVLSDDGQLDRAQLRRIVFADPAARKALESITHPQIGDAVLKALATPPRYYFVLVVPLLARSRLRSRISRVLVVDCPEATQMRRVLNRDGGNTHTAAGILAAQSSRADRLKLADDIISNDRDLDALRRQVQIIHQFYLAMACDAH